MERWMVICAKCGREIKGESSRLMWGGLEVGTYRLCGPMLEKKCERLYKEQQDAKTKSE